MWHFLNTGNSKSHQAKRRSKYSTGHSSHDVSSHNEGIPICKPKVSTFSFLFFSPQIFAALRASNYYMQNTGWDDEYIAEE